MWYRSDLQLLLRCIIYAESNFRTFDCKEDKADSQNIFFFLFLPRLDSQQWAMASSLSRLHDHRHISLGGTSPDEWPARHRDLYLTTHNTQNRQTSMPQTGFEPSIPASERPKTHALDRAATGLGHSRHFILFGATARHCARTSSFTRSVDHIQRHTAIGRTPLDEKSTRLRDLYLISHNTHNRETSMPPVGFEPTISACEQPQTYALDRAATGTGFPDI